MDAIRSVVTRGKRAVRPRLEELAQRARIVARLLRDPRRTKQIEWLGRGVDFTEQWPHADTGRAKRAENPLRAFFDARGEGRGIWKWDHYFDLYERHLRHFRGAEVHVLEIGVYAGGSLEMWRDYFGSDCRVYGVDIDESCKRFEDASTRIFIGDQADREFWRRFRAAVPRLDVVIDDGGHKVHQQVATLEELLPHLNPGGVYVCEDVHGSSSGFGAYVAGLVQALNAAELTEDFHDPERRLVSRTTGFQSLVDSIHVYPFAIVIVRRNEPLAELVAPQHGTDWGSLRR